MKKIVFPDYTNSSINMIASIKKSFGYTTKYNSLEALDKLLPKKHVGILLLDGMGMNILKKLPEDSFLRRHLLCDITSTYPSTTVAATTSILTGKTPSETGWIGWHQYFDSILDDVILFYGRGFYNDKPYPHITNSISYDYFFKDMKEQGFIHGPSYFLDGSNTLVEMLDKLKGDFSEDFKTISYCYWDQPDGLLHKTGTDSLEVMAMISEFDMVIADFCESLSEDSCLIITADHGHKDCLEINLNDYPSLTKYFTKKPSIESRCCAFFVNDDGFKDEFNRLFGNDFLLLSKEEFINKGFIGNGDKGNCFLGDYMALAIGDYYLEALDEGRHFKSNHAGLTEEEMIIPLIFFSK